MSRAPRYVGRAVGLGFAVAVLCGVGGAFVGEPVVAAVGRLVNHHELVLRGLGWCWGGLPFVVLVAAYTQRHRLSQHAKQVVAYALPIWAAAAALLIPGRHSTLEERFSSAYLDARPLAFGWAAGFLSTFATVLLVALLIIGWRKLTRTVTKQSVVILNRAITILWSVLAAAGLAAALIAPLP
ncbi:hypothetical protein EV644_103236 [Kribbella orskensis]|uniref:Uncharacterized protein n=1 Tax=Kribbella orskensis TaxID=2512216 RepID=A0ABY2BSP0_9ACTN|nr:MULTISPECIES: hypothetical protein [Kribbella]TCN39680.1 hypothetical protein EV642_106184 [Kribbella sp. VKM Ac-2500]TCO27537.1 hypothetical protein EV644_103236 [Kribbella orskensis]